MADLQDLFVERIREGENGAGPEYEHRGEWRQVEVHREEIEVRGGEPEVLEVRETHHGPIVNEPLGAGGGEPLALSWTGLSFPFYPSSGLDLGRAKSGRELVELFAEFHVPCMNLVWGDSSGSIGYKLVGKLPRRPRGVADLPKPGWTGDYDWDGYVPYDELPEIVDPEGGAIVTANNRIAPAGYPHHITSDYLDGYRAARIEQLLAERERWSLDDFQRMQMDVFSIPGEQTAHRLARLSPERQREVRAIERLRSWDHRLDPETVAGTIFQAFTVHFARAVSEAAIGDPELAERWRSKSKLGVTPMISAPWRFHARLLELWDDGDPEVIGGRSWDDLAMESLARALDDLERRYGPDPRAWRWGRVHGMSFAHPFAEGEGPAARVFERLLGRRREIGGGQETVNCTGFVPHGGDFTGVWGASYRLLADVGDPDRSRWQHMTGQSGHPGSCHYDDLIDDWVAGRTQPVAQPPVATLRLEPA
jgi:penicillin amidase